MNILKKLALGILSPLFIVLLFATAFDIGFIKTATHPATIKKIVSESGIYDSVIPSVLQQAGSIETNVGTFQADNPIIQKAANSAISPQFIQQNTESAIDSVYNWLDGAIPQPDFKIDLAGAKDNFANSVAGSVQARLASLPACTTPPGANFDAINATCLPRGVTAAAAADQLKSSLTGGQDFLQNTTINADAIKNSDNSQPVFQKDNIKQIPKQYQRAKKTPLILSVLTILVGVGIVFLSSTWQKGLRHIGINLVVIGVLMLVFSYALNRAVATKVVPKITIDNAALQTDIRNLATDLTQQIDKNYWYFGGLYTVLGAGAIVGSELHRRKAKPASQAASPVGEAAATPKPGKKTS